MHLEDIERVKQLKYKYCRAIDTCDIPLLASLITDDISVDYQGGSYRFEAAGKANFMNAIEAAFHADFVSSHAVHHPVIEVHDDGTADGHWTLIDWSLNLRDLRQTSGCSFYIDLYRKIGADWKIARSTYTRLFEEVAILEKAPNLTAHYLGRNRR